MAVLKGTKSKLFLTGRRALRPGVILALTVFICLLVTGSRGVAAAAGWRIGTVDDGGLLGDVGQYTSIAVDSSNYAHISYYDVTNADLKYAYQDVGGWYVETVDSTGNVGQYTSLRLDASNRPHISYYDVTNGDLKYAYKDGGGWHTETVDSTSDMGKWSSLALDNSGNPHISYYCHDPGGLLGLGAHDELRYAHKSGGSWTIETVHSAGTVGSYTSIALDVLGNPRISYYYWNPGILGILLARDELEYSYKDGSWTTEYAETTAGYYTSIALESGSGYPHISSYGSGLYHTYKDGSGWHTETVDTTGDVGRYTSIVLDGSNYPHISYYDAANGNLKYAYKDGSGWHITTVDSWGDVGSYSAIAMDGSGSPRISYYDATNGDLKYAWWDSVAPTVSSTDPSDGATYVPNSQNITVTFSENVQAGDNYNLIDLKHEDGTSIPFTKSIAGAVLTIDPQSDLSDGVTYTVYVPAGSVKDLANNSLTSDYSFSFTTPPVITITAPSDISGWTLDPLLSQPQTQDGILSVAVAPDSTQWEVTASDEDTVNTNGRMTAWNGSYDTGKKLQNAMKVAAAYEVTLPAGGKIYGSSGDKSFPVTFRQTVGWNDHPLPAGYSYRIVVTFTASITA
ncbi:MAG: Ig-like domain-containing protein [Bacillota bacterium]